MNVLYVMIGGFVGTFLRFGLSHITMPDIGFPIHTLITNLIGCFILGWFSTFVAQFAPIKKYLSPLIGTGIIGSFTTFSTFSIETIQMLEDHAYLYAIIYIFSSVVIGLTLVFSGRKIALMQYGKEVSQ